MAGMTCKNKKGPVGVADVGRGLPQPWRALLCVTKTHFMGPHILPRDLLSSACMNVCVCA